MNYYDTEFHRNIKLFNISEKLLKEIINETFIEYNIHNEDMFDEEDYNNIKSVILDLYKNIHSFIKQINDEITMLFTTRPNFPSKILNEYQINKPDITINNRNQVMYNRKKSMLFSINKSLNIMDMTPINKDDKDEYDNFMKSIKEKNIEKIKEKNQKLIHFK